MNIIARIEDEMIRALKEALPSEAYVAVFPDSPGDFDLAQYDLAVLVHYAGARYGGDGLSHPGQELRGMRFAVLVFVRGLRGPAGSYEALETVRRALQNRRFAGALPARVLAEQLQEENAGIWRWEMEFSVPAVAVAAHGLAPRTGGPMRFEQGG